LEILHINRTSASRWRRRSSPHLRGLTAFVSAVFRLRFCPGFDFFQSGILRNCFTTQINIDHLRGLKTFKFSLPFSRASEISPDQKLG
jgi:hypothetical protein